MTDCSGHIWIRLAPAAPAAATLGGMAGPTPAMWPQTPTAPLAPATATQRGMAGPTPAMWPQTPTEGPTPALSLRTPTQQSALTVALAIRIKECWSQPAVPVEPLSWPSAVARQSSVWAAAAASTLRWIAPPARLSPQPQPRPPVLLALLRALALPHLTSPLGCSPRQMTRQTEAAPADHDVCPYPRQSASTSRRSTTWATPVGSL
mmetsp:Transcript_147075/g.256808  ORF Transcript_147075/g.256808 Transcript_147075/m.256808 type:complete len:206 (+) Transcript_147075:321-938(+)